MQSNQENNKTYLEDRSEIEEYLNLHCFLPETAEKAINWINRIRQEHSSFSDWFNIQCSLCTDKNDQRQTHPEKPVRLYIYKNKPNEEPQVLGFAVFSSKQNYLLNFHEVSIRELH